MKLVTTLSLVVIASSALAGAAFADGFDCQTRDTTLNVKLYNHTHPESGTRNAAVMVLSDTSVSAGRKTIARFTDVNGTLASDNVLYVANVDLRFSDSNRKGENILGTKLGYIDTISAKIDFSYASPLRNGEQTRGTLTIAKRNGDEISADLDCTRYLKGE